MPTSCWDRTSSQRSRPGSRQSVFSSSCDSPSPRGRVSTAPGSSRCDGDSPQRIESSSSTWIPSRSRRRRSVLVSHAASRSPSGFPRGSQTQSLDTACMRRLSRLRRPDEDARETRPDTTRASTPHRSSLPGEAGDRRHHPRHAWCLRLHRLLRDRDGPQRAADEGDLRRGRGRSQEGARAAPASVRGRHRGDVDRGRLPRRRRCTCSHPTRVASTGSKSCGATCRRSKSRP